MRKQTKHTRAINQKNQAKHRSRNNKIYDHARVILGNPFTKPDWEYYDDHDLRSSLALTTVR